MLESLCSNCLQKLSNYRPEQQNISPPKISMGFLYNISLDLHFPFQSIALLMDCAKNRKAKNFNIRIVKIQNHGNRQSPTQSIYEENYIQIKFNGNVFSNDEAHKFANLYQMTQQNKFDFGVHCRLGMLGLGKTNLFVCNDGKYRKIILFSVDDRINSKYYKEPVGCLWIEQIQTGKIQSLGGQYDKNLIKQVCKMFSTDEQVIFSCPEGWFKLLIFHARILVTSKKLMFYELSESHFNRDIEIYHNASKIQFLDKLGYEVVNHAEISLAGYCSLLYLNKNLKVKIGNCEQQHHGLTYQAYLDQLNKNDMIVKILADLPGAKKTMLYKAKQGYFAHNNGILIYYNGRLINRYQTDFGKMMQQCFYRKRYKPIPKNFFEFLGIIQLQQSIKPNILHNNIASMSPMYRKLVVALNQILDLNQKQLIIDNQPQQIIAQKQVSIGIKCTRSCNSAEKKKEQLLISKNKKNQKDSLVLGNSQPQKDQPEPRKRTKLDNKQP